MKNSGDSSIDVVHLHSQAAPPTCMDECTVSNNALVSILVGGIQLTVAIEVSVYPLLEANVSSVLITSVDRTVINV